MWLRSALLAGLAGLAALAVSLGACALDDIDVEEPATSTVVSQVAAGCPDWNCTTNDPQLLNSFGPPVKFYELNEKGIPNKQGITVVGIDIGLNTYSVDVLGAKIYARKSGFPTVSGTGLRGSFLRLKYKGVEFKLKIEEVGATALWPWDGAAMETYKISYHEVGTPDGGVWPNLCSLADTLPSEPPEDPHGAVGYVPSSSLLGQNKWTLVAYEGERYDSVYKTVSPAIDKDWFTLGCAGHVLSKLPVLRHSWITQGGAYTNSYLQRQAMLKMFAGDYCGKGRSYTYSLEPFVWKGGFFSSFALPPLDLEARWGPGGALCLNDARLNRTANPQAMVDFPNGVSDAIKAECPQIPVCGIKYGDVDPEHQFDATFNGANPN